MGVQVGGLDVVTLLGAIAGDRGGGGCIRWRIGRGAIAGCNRLDVVPLLGVMVRCHCWMPWWCWAPLLLPLLDARGGEWL